MTGTYSDGVIRLTLNEDNTFTLTRPDPIFPYTYASFSSNGTWRVSGHTITLNPEKKKRIPEIEFKQRVIDDFDSIRIKINYQTEEYENEIPVSKTAMPFDMFTVYINKGSNFYHLVYKPKLRHCGFAPVIKKQLVVDTTNTIVLPRQEINCIGISTYGFDKPVELKPAGILSNDFEITVIQPVDKDRTPRSKRIIIKGKNAFFYENRKGRISTGGWYSPLKKL